MSLEKILTSVPNSKIPPHHTLTSLSLTHVQFSDTDIYSKIFAHLTLSPLAITCGIIATVLTTRDLTVILMLIGQLLNECTNFVLKRLVKQARPTEYLGDGYGMPSSHSQFMAYFATYVIILMFRWGYNGGVSPIVVTCFVLLWSSLVIYSRVHLFYHTWQQVVAGTLCGVAFATGYYFFVNRFLRSKGLMDWMLDNPFGQWAYLRDVEQMDHIYRWEREQFDLWRNAGLGKAN
ncbi:dolichyldiphosphatase [Entomortierella parvispora]|uniref:Dolichyldiphosphatase n=1 Tax=Entomortierella parvispora TaxID=205924 RepID=A0A9P3LYJ5_9FUNG|nr:dolichyldiphosphatase [Entomortierella parvispora]